MSTIKEKSAEKKETLSQKEGKSFEESKNESRDKAGAMALSAEARTEGAGDIIGALPNGEISETIKEDNAQKGDAATGGTTQQDDNSDEDSSVELAEIAPPPQKIMIRKVRVALQQEIKETQKEAKKLEKHPQKYAFELSEKINVWRKLYFMFQEIRYQSTDYIKGMWMDTQKGKKIGKEI